MLGQSINATVSNVDDNAKNYWFKFDCLSSNYYDLLTSSQALTSADVFLTVYNADKTRQYTYSCNVAVFFHPNWGYHPSGNE